MFGLIPVGEETSCCFKYVAKKLGNAPFCYCYESLPDLSTFIRGEDSGIKKP